MGSERHRMAHLFDASVMIITFVLTGRCLEEKAKDSTASSIRQLMGMQPKTARLVTYEKIEGTNDYKMEEVPISTIQIGDMIEVRAGERFRWMAWLPKQRVS